MNIEEATVETWTPTMELRQHHKRGGLIPGTGGAAYMRDTVLEQKWVSASGAIEWRAIPEFSDNPEEPALTVQEQAARLLKSLADNAVDPQVH